jgi:hypothetical protein
MKEFLGFSEASWGFVIFGLLVMVYVYLANRIILDWLKFAYGDAPGSINFRGMNGTYIESGSPNDIMRECQIELTEAIQEKISRTKQKESDSADLTYQAINFQVEGEKLLKHLLIARRELDTVREHTIGEIRESVCESQIQIDKCIEITRNTFLRKSK